MDFKPNRSDPDLWIKESEDGKNYEYITTYVDDIIIVADKPMKYLEIIKSKFPIRNIEEMPEHYLGNNLEMQSKITIKVSSRKYITEIISRYEKKHGSLKSRTYQWLRLINQSWMMHHYWMTMAYDINNPI